MPDKAFDDLPPDDQARALEKLADIIAIEREHSNVSADVRQRISAIADEELAGRESISEEALVSRIVGELSPNDLKGIVADWLRMQGAV